jgi:hypothetical protein
LPSSVTGVQTCALPIWEGCTHKFIEFIITRNTLNAALNRPSVYLNANANQRILVRETISVWLHSLSLRYFAWEYTDQRYLDEIVALSAFITSGYNQILQNGLLNIGRAQKLISLYLKFLWLSGAVSKKPRFAVLDRGIIEKSNYPNRVNWTEIFDIQEYNRIVSHIDRIAINEGYENGSTWEAEAWLQLNEYDSE